MQTSSSSHRNLSCSCDDIAVILPTMHLTTVNDSLHPSLPNPARPHSFTHWLYQHSISGHVR